MKVLITGACGFIGCHTADRFANAGDHVILLDNLSRPGSEENLRWITSRHDCEFVKADIRDASEMKKVVSQHADIDAVIHLAAQVAVTTSVRDPRADFEINALGTFNLLEAVRSEANHPPAFLFSSTNKVYGGLESQNTELRDGRWQFADAENGISEQEALDFHSPYGCSKGAGDQYVRDYGRIYGIPTVVLRQSCIYGTRQFGVEDQGWVAWFCIAAQLGRCVTVYGDGRQIRDLLYVEDLTDLYRLAIQNAPRISGEAFNAGGGATNTLSLRELLSWIQNRQGQPLSYLVADERPGDQKVFVSDNSKLKALLGWEPKTSVSEGLNHLFTWIEDNREYFDRPDFGGLPLTARSSKAA